MHYFFGQVDFEKNTVLLENEEAHHCALVLRMQKGEKIGVLVSQPSASICYAELNHVHKKICTGKILEIQAFPPPKVQLQFIISPPKNNERLEWLVEKLVELQAGSIYFVKSERCIRKSINLNRLHQISLAAAKQSANPILPELKYYSSLDSLLSELPEDALHLLLHCEPSEQKVLPTLTLFQNIQKQNLSDIIIYIGPEGDWTIEEINTIRHLFNNILEIDLGNTRLRTETAVICTASLLKIIQS